MNGRAYERTLKRAHPRKKSQGMCEVMTESLNERTSI